MWDCIVVGGGAAGLWGGGTAALRGRKVLVLEKNVKAGVKILMSGGTRCNITHACSPRAIAEAFGKQGRFLLSPLSRLGPDDVVQHFLRLGVPCKVEETGKVFPVSDRAIDVRDALVARLCQAGGSLKLGVAVKNLHRIDNGSGFIVDLDGEELRASRVLLTTGGLSFPGCGTTGDGYAWLRAFGHTVTPLRPALTPILSPAQWVHQLSGITLDDVSVTAVPTGTIPSGKERLSQTSRGGFLWTHFGFSGPTAMNVSKYFSDQTDFRQAFLSLDLLPDLSYEACRNWLETSARIRDKQKQIANCLDETFPKRLVHTMLKLADIPIETRMAELSNKRMTVLVESIKRWRVPVGGTRGYAKAEVTAGGVALQEVDATTMESRLVPGLFLAGEILDLDGPIGGFNFQSAWSTGHAAGESM